MSQINRSELTREENTISELRTLEYPLTGST